MAELIKNEVIVEEKSKEEKVKALFTSINNRNSAKMVKLLYKFELYNRKEVSSFNEEEYTDVTYKNGVAGYAVYQNAEGALFLVKELSAEAEEKAYGFEILELATLSHEEMHNLIHYANRHPKGMYAIIGGMCFGLLLGLVVFFALFFDSLGTSDLITSLTYAYFYAGGYVTVGVGVLGLLLRGLKRCSKGHKC